MKKYLFLLLGEQFFQNLLNFPKNIEEMIHFLIPQKKQNQNHFSIELKQNLKILVGQVLSLLQHHHQIFDGPYCFQQHGENHAGERRVCVFNRLWWNNHHDAFT